jgi:DNA-binding NtrC family response regulator
MEKPSKAILLIVDDESTVCRALSRVLGRSVDEVIVACTIADAETILATRNVTHLLCDHWFGPGQPLGLQQALEWKKRHPSIKKAVLLTGTDVADKSAPPGLDGIMSKSVDPEELVKVLGLDDQSSCDEL